MRRCVPLLLLLPLLGACATAGGSVTLLPGEAGAGVGAVAVFDARNGAELGQLTAANTQTALGGKVTAVPAATRYDVLLSALPPPAAHYTLYFQEGGVKLTPESEPELKKVFAEIAQRGGAEVQITGH
ncbi:MAG TPA: hypothetical protein VGC92_12075, partial [Phenylobacterium sp.]